MFWGLTPSLDLLEELKLDGSIPSEVNILLIGGSDARHIIKTLSQKYTKTCIKINFYIIELVPEVIAKQLLLLNIALQPVKELGTVQKTRIFMELFGNSLIRPSTSKFLTNKATEFVKMITNFDYMKEIMPFINIDLKYKERDYLENLFKFWTSSGEFDICTSWDRRLRNTLGLRYDTRKGVFDWDLHMRYNCIGGQHICTQEYQSFRRNGVAFTWLECEVSKPNRSMVCGVIANGDKFAHYGYLGDLVSGPFIAYGLSCDDEKFIRKSNNKNQYRSTDLTERNLREMFHKLEFNTEYEHQTTTDIALGAVTTQFYEMKVIDNFNNDYIKKKKMTKSIEIEGCMINFLSINTLLMMPHKEQYKDFFNLIYFNNSYLKYLMKDLLSHISASKGLLIIENQIFVLSHRDKDLNEYFKNFMEKLDGLEMVACPFDVQKDVYAKFILK